MLVVCVLEGWALYCVGIWENRFSHYSVLYSINFLCLIENSRKPSPVWGVFAFFLGVFSSSPSRFLCEKRKFIDSSMLVFLPVFAWIFPANWCNRS